jgi:hypothetical protein
MAIKFKTNVAQTLTFTWGDCMEVNGQYGPQFLYTIEVEGQRDKLYATPSLHRQLQDAHVGPGCVLTITKIEGEGNRKEWVVEPETEGEVEAEEEEWQPVEEKRNGQPTNGEGKSNGHSVENAIAPTPTAPGNGKPTRKGPTFSSLKQLMDRSLKASWESWCALEDGPAFSGEDVRAVAITLFLECARKGISLQPIEEELPF